MVVDEPETEFFDKVKTIWDDTKVLCGVVDEYIATARRSGNDWSIGAITNTEARQMSLPLNFIEPNKKYVAHLYVDDETVSTKTKVRLLKYIVTSNDVLSLSLNASVGVAVHLEPATNQNLRQYKKLPDIRL